jgi:Ca2+-binding RTX toxin-like protein
MNFGCGRPAPPRDNRMREHHMSTVVGTDGAETLDAADGVTNGDDQVYGYGGIDTIFALGGNDFIRGGAGADRMDGGTGRDVSDYSDSDVGVFVSLTSGQGFNGTAEGDRLFNIESLMGSRHGDWLIGNDDVNALWGFDGNDALKGGGGADFLYGGNGGDTLDGGADMDTVVYRDSPVGVFVSLIDDVARNGTAESDHLDNVESLYGSDYHDDLWGDDGVNLLQGLDGDDTLKGYGADDTLIGNEGDDTLYGMNGHDVLYGHGDDDLLIGGAGHDTMRGGTGADTFRITALSDAPVGAAGFTDYIPDFSSAQHDQLDLSAIDANTRADAPGDQAFTAIGVEVAFHGVAGELRYNGGFLEGDVNGDAVADFRIQFDVPFLTEGIDIIM